ncbi:MAG: cob(I)yrinic acid a,c-diamide adenosyltransferase [Candidatus Paceibacterota bacterium]|jgi:cob(I)alamin adenosyltransferase
MLYTRKGDAGTTKTFGCDQRFSKSSSIADALGTLDETNSFLGFAKLQGYKSGFMLGRKTIGDIVNQAQENLFIVQAEVAGAPKKIDASKVKEIETMVDAIEKELPPIKTFFISGGTELGSLFDFARTLARRAERRVVGVHEEGLIKISKNTLAYMNRLSSLLYALARLANHRNGIAETAPDYK